MTTLVSLSVNVPARESRERKVICSLEKPFFLCERIRYGVSSFVIIMIAFFPGSATPAYELY